MEKKVKYVGREVVIVDCMEVTCMLCSCKEPRTPVQNLSEYPVLWIDSGIF
jgi:hypothetical protein